MRLLPLLLLGLCFWATPAFSQRTPLSLSPFTDLSESQLPTGGERRIVPQQFRAVRLDVSAVEGFFQKIPLENSGTATTALPVLTLPLPDGKMGRFRLLESPLMHEDLQRKYPDIRCYIGQGIDDPSATLSCDLTPWGFHAMILSDRMGTVFVDPYAHGDREYYSVYFKKDYRRADADTPFACSVEDDLGTEIREGQGDVPEFQGDCRLRTYRLALACTGEYASFHGGTVPLVLAAMNTSMNRVNGVFRRELSITMRLVPKNDTLIFLSAGSDPYANTNGSTMLGQNTTVCNARIGVANFDIGHVFSTGGGGIASLGSVCNSTNKAKGVTGSSQPIGDAFDIDYVAHEMGHQFGGPHTFNGTLGSCAGNGNAATAVEPGSGTTIMAYAGICGANNVQNNSNDYFHASSLQSIGTYTTTGTGNGCAVKTVTGNTAPTANAGPDYILPKSTPFYLTATGSDIDGDTLSYCWEQMDAGSGTLPPASTNIAGPMFRSFSPTAGPTRYFPRLSDLNSNTNYSWEELPSVARTMRFRVTVRDNNFGSGCTKEDDMTVTINAAAGPFLVTVPNTNVLWTVGETQTVTWNVAATDVAPISCTRVRILLSNNGGLTYPFVLAEDVPNTGTASVLVPDLSSSLCRVKVESIGNIFYDISNVNFRIQQPTSPTFLLNTATNTLQACSGDTTYLPLSITALLGFNSPVQLSVSGGPAGASLTFSPNPVTPTGDAALSLADITPDMVGTYTLTLTATSSGITRTASIALTVKAGKPATSPTLLSPADGQTALSSAFTLDWTALPRAATYVVQLSSSPGFETNALIANATVTTDSFQVSNLPTGVYYWRVLGGNDCGQTAYAPTAAFQIGKGLCNQTFLSTDTPQPISGTTASTLTSVIAVPVALSTNDINVEINADHEWVGDLSASLVSPSGKKALLFDRVGAPADPLGCDGQNLQLLFDDEAVFTAQDLESSCAPTFPALAGSFQPVQALSTLEGSKNVKGNWTLELTDHADESGGSLISWSLVFCFPDTVAQGQLLALAPLTVPTGGSAAITENLLLMNTSGTTGQGRYVLLSTPRHGSLLAGNTPLAVGSTFTQADLQLGAVTYAHSGDTSTADSFHFDALDESNQAWIHDSVFHILVKTNDLTLTVALTKEVLCHNGTGGELSASATGLDGNYLYSLGGGPAQSSPVFTDLAPGLYTVVVMGQYGFTATATATVPNPTLLEVAANVTDNDLAASALGGAGGYVYSLDGTTFQADGLFADLPNGTYILTVRDTNGCTATDTAVVLVNTLAVFAQMQQPASCYGGADGRLSVSVAGGERPLQSYSLNGGPAQSDSMFTGLAAGLYTVVVTDAVGFTRETAAVEITQPDPISPAASVQGNSMTASATGGTSPYLYSVDGQSFQVGSQFENMLNGIYALTVHDDHGCTATTTFIIAVDALLATVTAQQQVSCFGDSNGSLSVLAGGGQPPYEYRINGGAYQPSPIFNGLAAGPYVVDVKDSAGVEATAAAVIITQPSAVELTAEADYNLIHISASGGAGSYAYSLNGQTYQADSNFVVLASGTYVLIARDEAGCTGTASVSVSIAPLTGIPSAAPILCHGNLTTVEVAAAGGIAPYTYQLGILPAQSSPLFEGLAAGEYSITIRDLAGTDTVLTLTLTEPDTLDAAITVLGNDASLTLTGGTPPYSYTLNGQVNASLENLPNGNYTIVAVDANGCSASTSFTISYTPLSAQAQVSDPNVCDMFYNITVMAFGGVPPFQYALDAQPFGSNPVFTDVSGSMHTVRVLDAQGVMVSTEVSNSLPDPVDAAATIVGDSIVAAATGGISPYTYALNGGNYSSNPVFANLPTGSYTVTVRDSRGCTSMLSGLNVTSSTVEPAAVWGASLSPNPTTGLLRLYLAQPPAQLRVQVADATGRLLHALEFSPGGAEFTTMLDLSDLPQGMYVLRLTDGQHTGAMRVSVVR